MKTATFHELLDNHGLAVEVKFSQFSTCDGLHTFFGTDGHTTAVISVKYSFTIT